MKVKELKEILSLADDEKEIIIQITQSNPHDSGKRVTLSEIGICYFDFLREFLVIGNSKAI